LKQLPVIQALLDMVEGAAALLNADGCIVEMNRRFRSLAESRTLFNIDRRQRISLQDSAHERLRKSLAVATSGSATTKAAVFPASLNGKRWVIAVLPVDATNLDDAYAMLIMTPASQRSVVSADLLRPHYGLTNAEAEVTACIAHGHSVSDAAALLGVSKATARNQLAAAMTKMGVSRQAGLVARATTIMPRLVLKGHASMDGEH
jgi:DNA-binding CsgD family transcriptional regulator